jgi:hypothetical protein
LAWDVILLNLLIIARILLRAHQNGICIEWS